MRYKAMTVLLIETLISACSDQGGGLPLGDNPSICVSDRYIKQFSARVEVKVEEGVGACFHGSVVSNDPIMAAANFIGSMRRKNGKSITVQSIDGVVYCCLLHEGNEDELKSYVSLLHEKSRASDISNVANKQVRKILADNGISDCSNCDHFAKGDLVSGLTLDVGVLCKESDDLRDLISDIDRMPDTSFLGYVKELVISDFSNDFAVREMLSRATVIPCGE